MAAKTILQTFSLLCTILIAFETVAVQSQECKNIEHTIAIDENLNTALLGCDIDVYHEVRIFKAEYRILKDERYALSEDEDTNYSCLIRGLTTEVKDKCHRNFQCLFTKEDFETYEELSADTYPYKCDEFTGRRYLMITWQCRAELNKDYNAYAIDLLDNKTHEITFAVIDSHSLWRWVLDYCHPQINVHCQIPERQIRDYVLITEHNMGCSFVIPANTELWVYAHEIYKFPPENQPDYYISKCSQRIQLYDDERRWEICEQGDFFRLPCQDTDQTLYLTFENDDPNVRSGFAIYVEVDYLAAPMMMSTCGIPVNQLPAAPNVDASSAKTTTTTTTIAPMRTPPATTTAPPKPKKSSSFEFFEDMPAWVLVLLAVVISVIIMLIVISIVCLRHCCGAGKDQHAKDDEDDLARSESSWGGEVSTVYVDGDRSSKLVVHSLKASSRSQGDLPFTY